MITVVPKIFVVLNHSMHYANEKKIGCEIVKADRPLQITIEIIFIC